MFLLGMSHMVSPIELTTDLKGMPVLGVVNKDKKNLTRDFRGHV
ncbi:Uncharacterised protein [Zhongshania aliphaticivorans]|nr:Uncharacterised protein [Zhongshania aliphaticivorans]